VQYLPRIHAIVDATLQPEKAALAGLLALTTSKVQGINNTQ
jgi:hypothetical protein